MLNKKDSKVQFISKLNNHEGVVCDYYLYQKNNNIWKAIIKNEDGTSYYIIDVNNYKKELEEHARFIELNFDEKADIKNIELLFLLLIEEFLEESIIYSEHDSKIDKNYFYKELKERQEICKEDMDLFDIK